LVAERIAGGRGFTDHEAESLSDALKGTGLAPIEIRRTNDARPESLCDYVPARQMRENRKSSGRYSARPRRQAPRRQRGRENVHKRSLLHVAGYDLGLIMHLLSGVGMPRGLRARLSAHFAACITPSDGLFVRLDRRCRRSSRRHHRQHRARPLRLTAGFINRRFISTPDKQPSVVVVASFEPSPSILLRKRRVRR